jgi:hypothetical protein
MMFFMQMSRHQSSRRRSWRDETSGQSVAVSGGTVVVGANGEASNATGVTGDQANNSIQDSGAV